MPVTSPKDSLTPKRNLALELSELSSFYSRQDPIPPQTAVGPKLVHVDAGLDLCWSSLTSP